MIIRPMITSFLIITFDSNALNYNNCEYNELNDNYDSNELMIITMIMS